LFYQLVNKSAGKKIDLFISWSKNRVFTSWLKKNKKNDFVYQLVKNDRGEQIDVFTSW